VGVGVAFALALLVATWQERPQRRSTWIARLAIMALAGWGILALAVYFHVRFGDMFVYAHARTRYYHYTPSLTSIFHTKAANVAQSIWAAPNDGIWLAAGLLWFALGHKQALGGFSLVGKVYWYALYAVIVGMSAASQAELSFGGLSRYLLLAVPLFFAMASSVGNNALAIATWGILSFLHYWSVGSCFYVSEGRADREAICHMR
jgi:hypothetical protein